MTMTKRDAIVAAMSVAEDVDAGRLDPAALERQVVAELSELVGTVVGPDDPIWELQVQIARGVLAAGGIEADTLSEWAAVARRRDGAPDVPAQPIPIAPEPHVLEIGDAIADEVEPESVATDGDQDQNADAVPDPAATGDECVPCQSTPAMVTTADGRQIPSRLIAARGRGFPDAGLRG